MNGVKKILLIVLVAACGVLSSVTAAVVEDAAAADKPTATVVGSSDAQTVPNSSGGGLRRLARPQCDDTTCRLECKNPSPCTLANWDSSCCDQCPTLAPEGVCSLLSTPCDGALCTADCVNIDPTTYRCLCPIDNACNGGNCTAVDNGDYICTSCTPQWMNPANKCQDDVDECAEGGSNNCHVDAGCTNERGGFSCSCKDGYSGDGTTDGTGCTNDNECLLGTDNCHENAICSDTEGGFTCACKPGYTGDGYISGTGCTDVDECAEGGSNNCTASEICINTLGSFDCGIDQCQTQTVCGGTCRNGDQSSFICNCPSDANPCVSGFKCEAGINENYSCVPDSTGLCSNDQTECSVSTDCKDTCFLGKDDGKACTTNEDCTNTLRCTSGANVGFECTTVGTNTGECPPVKICEGGSFVGRECTSQSDCNRGKKTEGTCTGIKEEGKCEIYIPGECQPDITTCDSIDHCESNPCKNGGTCTDIGPTFECQCPTDFEGRICNGEDQLYRYDDTGTGRCGIQSDAIPTSSNIVLQFFALGDFPYDEESTTTASGVNKAKCGTDNSDDSPENADTCTYGGRSFKCTSECTYEGQEYACWRDDIIPWMKNPERTSSSSWVTAAKPAFSVHVGDFLKGNGSGNSGRCNPDSFASRQALFAGMTNPLVTTGDNDWNECNNFTSAHDNIIQQMWRDNFARDDQFSDFTTDFPSYPISTGYGQSGTNRPTLERQLNYEENFFFLHNDVVVIGLNRPQGWNDLASVNAAFVKEQLENMHTAEHNIFTLNQHSCEAVKSIVIATHVPYPNEVRIEIENYFKKCGRTLLGHVGPEDGTSITVLNIVGNGHTYCPQKTTDDALEMEFMVGGEEASDAHLVSVLADPNDPSKHYFHFERNNAVSATCY